MDFGITSNTLTCSKFKFISALTFCCPEFADSTSADPLITKIVLKERSFLSLNPSSNQWWP